MKKTRKMISFFVFMCVSLMVMMAPSASAYVMTDLERALQDPEAYVVGTYLYDDMSITVVSGDVTYSYEVPFAAEPRLAATYELQIFSEEGTRLFIRSVALKVNGSSGSYSLGPTNEWNWYTTNLASGVLLGGVANTRVSNVVGEHAFTWYYRDVKFRSVAKFTLNTSTGKIILSGFENTKI